MIWPTLLKTIRDQNVNQGVLCCSLNSYIFPASSRSKHTSSRLKKNHLILFYSPVLEHLPRPGASSSPMHFIACDQVRRGTGNPVGPGALPSSIRYPARVHHPLPTGLNQIDWRVLWYSQKAHIIHLGWGWQCNLHLAGRVSVHVPSRRQETPPSFNALRENMTKTVLIYFVILQISESQSPANWTACLLMRG